MKRKLLTLILVFAALALSCNRAPAPLQGAIEMLTGNVTITENGVSARAQAGDIVRKDAMITTGENSFAQVSVSGNLVQVFENSSIILSGLVHGESGAEETTVRVGAGTIFSRVKKMMISRGDSFTVPSCVMVAAVRGTEFLYSVDCSKGLVATYKGTVSVRNTGSMEETLVPAGQMITLETGKKSSAAPIPKNFRYRDFVYKKSTSTTESASGDGSEVARGGQKRGTKTESTEKSGLSSTGKKSVEPAVIKKKESGNSSGEAASVKRNDEGATAVAKKTGAKEKKGAAVSTTNRTVKPGSLLDKPRVNLPELK
jgi:hypothetical protein